MIGKEFALSFSTESKMSCLLIIDSCYEKLKRGFSLSPAEKNLIRGRNVDLGYSVSSIMVRLSRCTT